MLNLLSTILVVLGLCLFETISSIDNAIINAQVLSTMQEKARRWFLIWGLLFAVFIVRGILPWLIVWATNPTLGPAEAFTSTLHSDPKVVEAIEESAPILLMGGGVFLVFLFFHWLFLEPKYYGLCGECFIAKQGVWFYAVASILLTVIVYLSLTSFPEKPMIAFGAVVGSTAFFITHGFKENAEKNEAKLLEESQMSDISKILYLEVIDMTFSIDGVIGAFAFTMSVPLILIGNGLGAVMVREITVSNIDRIKKYKYLKNGAMYSILCLGTIMILDGFGHHIPEWLSPAITFITVGYFFHKSKKEVEKNAS